MAGAQPIMCFAHGVIKPFAAMEITTSHLHDHLGSYCQWGSVSAGMKLRARERSLCLHMPNTCVYRFIRALLRDTAWTQRYVVMLFMHGTYSVMCVYSKQTDITEDKGNVYVLINLVGDTAADSNLHWLSNSPKCWRWQSSSCLFSLCGIYILCLYTAHYTILHV